MCGRYRLSRRKQIIEEHFDSVSGEEPTVQHRPNLARPRHSPASKGPIRVLSLMGWGLIPSWAKAASIAASTINARSETAATKLAFRDVLRLRRCLIPADGSLYWTAAIVGIAMEIGIEPTVRHGADLGYIPVVVKDACSFGHREAAERSIASLELMSALRRTADAQASLQEQFDRYKFDRYKCELQDSNHVGARVPADVLVRQEPGEEEGEEEDEGDGKEKEDDDDDETDDGYSE
jgi:nicotinamidase-related amidase